jgi:hypothetical protein
MNNYWIKIVRSIPTRASGVQVPQVFNCSKKKSVFLLTWKTELKKLLPTCKKHSRLPKALTIYAG